MSRRLAFGAAIGLSLTLACNAELTQPVSSPTLSEESFFPASANGIPTTVEGRLSGGGQIREGRWKISFAGWARGDAAHAPNQWSEYRWEGAEAIGQLVVQFHTVSVAAVSGGRFKATGIDRIVFVGAADPSPTCLAARGINTTGQFNGEPGWTLDLFFSDSGGSGTEAVPDRVRITLSDPAGTLVYYEAQRIDWDPPGKDFPQEGACLGPFRTELDAGNWSVVFR